MKTVHISRFNTLLRAAFVLCLLLSGPFTAQAQDTRAAVTPPGTAALDSSLDAADDQAAANAGPRKMLISELAATSDVVAIAQVLFTNYEYRRGFPVDGYADLRVLIPYKTNQPLERIRVRDSGLHSGECYFPTTLPGEEGARFLVFLSRHPDGDFRGNPLSCKLGVLVTDNHAYALRYPLDGNTRLDDEQQDWVEKLTFNDPNAFAGDPDMTPGRKQALAELIDGEVADQGVKYTNGLPIRYFSQLIGEDNLQRPSRQGRY